MAKSTTLGLLAISIVLVSSCSARRPDMSGGDAGAVNEPPALSLRVSEFEEVGGTGYLIARVVESIGGAYVSSGSYGDTRTRNLVFLDRNSLESHRLFETNQKLILDVDHLGRGNRQGSVATPPTSPPVKWLMFRVVNTDTNRDKRLDANDSFELGISDAFGVGYTEVLSNVYRVLSVSMIGEDQVMVAFESAGGGAQACRIDLPTRTVVVSAPLTGVAGVASAPPN